VEALKQVALFRELADRELDLIVKRGMTRSYNDGAYIVREGDQGEAFFILLTGEAGVVKESNGKSGTLVAYLKAGDYFGEMAILNRYERSASVIARGQVECLALSESDFMEIVRKHPEISVKLLQEMSRRLREMDEKLSV
jgi:CRP-like cAMP-binding protein